MRRALRIGAPLLAVTVAADALHLLLRFGEAAAPSVGLEATLVAVSLALSVVARRRSRQLEPAALAIVAALYAVTLLNVLLLPATATSGIAYLAVIMVVSALFLSWSPRWHAAWLAAAMAMTAAFLLMGLNGTVQDRIAAGLIMASVMGVAGSLIGHRLAYARLRRMLEQQFQLRALSRHTRRQERAVEELNRELVRTARLDTVTGIGNRRALDDALTTMLDRRLAVVLLDVDHFKAYNDRNGHLAGDAALARVGGILRGIVRGGDMVFRYGGEEFLILLPDADREGATRLAERVRRAIQEETASDLGLTVSAGVAVADRFSSSSPLQLLRRADAALYRAKRTGRNRVVVDELGLPVSITLAG